MSAIAFAFGALAATAAAQSACTVSATTTISNAAAITSCGIFSGSIAIAQDAGDIDFGSSLQRIDGDLVANGSSVTSLSGAALGSITGSFILEQARSITAINFNRLSQVGTVQWTTVPNLVTLNFGPGVQQIDSFTVTDSGIQDLSNINLKSAETVVISQNNRLNSLSWQTGNVTAQLTLDSNGLGGPNGFSAHFPNLAQAGQISINRVGSLDFSSLQNATSISIYNTAISNLTFPNLTMTAQTIDIHQNTGLRGIAFPELQTVGGALLLYGNTQLGGVLSFPALTNLANLNITGVFSGLSLPKINTIRGTANVVSSDPTFSCDTVNGYATSGVINTRPSCTAGSAQGSSSVGSNSGGSGTGGTRGSTSTGAAARVDLGTATLFGATGLFAAMLGMI